jgi:tetratricopeptide (TPR) repeat protein
VPDSAPKQQYSRAEVCRMLLLSERQLRAWERLGLIAAAQTWSFRDLLRARAIRELRACGVPLRQIGRALESLKRQLPEIQDPLSELKIFREGRRIAVRFNGQDMEALTGQTLFNFDAAGRASVKALPAQASPPRERESEAWFQKGLFLEETGAPIEEALEAYRRAVEFNPQAAGALVNLGTIHYRQGKFKEAERYYAQALEADAHYPLAHFNLGNLYDERGDLAKAQHCYEAALRLNPAYGDAHFNLALLCERKGDLLKAISHWKAYLKLDSGSTWSDIARRQLEKLRVALLS